ncbi:MAG: DUF4440 domain-containing protein [Holophagae bacterium]|jgi:ketosteroid isomerase-like protein
MTRALLDTTVISILVGLAAAAALPVAAQGQAVPAVPKDACCFANFRYSGTCQVVPRQGQICQNILDYLNNINSAGESYCGSTPIRGGWASVDCASGRTSSPVGTMKKEYVTPQQPAPAPVVSPSRRPGSRTGATAPSAVEPGELQATDTSVIQVRLEQPLGDATLTAGQRLSGRLESDLVAPDGAVLVPAGSMFDATVGAEPSWTATPTTGAKLELVGTTTSAADLFGATGETGPAGGGEPGAIQLTGEMIDLSPDSVLTLRLNTVADQPADLRVLTTATDVWMEAFNNRDVVTLAGLWSEDGAMLPPNGAAVIGRDAIYEYWKRLLAASTTRLELDNVETVVQGDLAYKAGRFELIDSETDAAVDQGKYVQIWKRSPQGYWELHRDIWNSSLQDSG